MAVIASDGLSLLIGDGDGSEVFNPLKGAAIARLEISQRNYLSNAVTSDAWQVNVGAAERRVVLEGDAYATDDAAAIRLRSLTLSAGVGNFKLKLSAAETLQFAAIVTLYEERVEQGIIKKLHFKLESSAAASIV